MSTLTLVKPESLDHAAHILWALLRAPKGREHLLYVDRSEEMDRHRCNVTRTYLRDMVQKMRLPYHLHFWAQQIGICCYWMFCGDESMREAQRVFDENAAQGLYPEIRSYHPERPIQKYMPQKRYKKRLRAVKDKMKPIRQDQTGKDGNP